MATVRLILQAIVATCILIATLILAGNFISPKQNGNVSTSFRCCSPSNQAEDVQGQTRPELPPAPVEEEPPSRNADYVPPAGALPDISNTDKSCEVDTGHGKYNCAIASQVSVAIVDSSVGQFLFSYPFIFGAPTKADGKFIVVTVSIHNFQSTAITMNAGLFEILDASGNVYSASEHSADVEQSEQLFLSDLNPGITKEGKVVFDVPESLSTDNLELRFRGGMTGDVAELPLKIAVAQSPDTSNTPQSDDSNKSDIVSIRKAAEAGDFSAIQKLAVLYNGSNGTPPNYTEFCFWSYVELLMPDQLKKRVAESGKPDDQRVFEKWYADNQPFFTYEKTKRIDPECGSHLTSDEFAQQQQRAREWLDAHQITAGF